MSKIIEQERRKRYLASLISESVINVLAEQDGDNQQVSAAPPSPVEPSPQTNQQQPPTENAEQQPQEDQFTVDHLVDKLNVLRGGKSFTDPEVFGRLTTFFNGLTDEQKTSLNYLLTEMGKIVIGVSEEQAGMEHQQQQPVQKSQSQQVPPPKQAAPQQAPSSQGSAPIAPV